MAMKTFTNRMIQVANLIAGRTVTGSDKAHMRQGHRSLAFLSYPPCLPGLSMHEPCDRGVTLGDDPTAIRAGRLVGPRLSWPRSSRLFVARRVAGKSATTRAA